MKILDFLKICCALLIVLMSHKTSAAQDEIEEITVFATKRAAPLQNVPIAVSVIGANVIAREGVDNLRDLQRVTPSLTVSANQSETSASTIRLRGIGTAGNNIGMESSVGMFLDGVYLSRPGVALGDLFDVRQVEIMHGPQGTLFGRNTSAGALNILTKRPQLETRESWVDLGIGNFSAWNIRGGANIPLVEDRAAIRLSGAVRQRDGYVKSTTGAESRTRDRYSLRGQVLWHISDDVELRVIADYADADEGCCDAPITADSPLVALGAFAAAGLPADGGAPVTGAAAREGRISNSEGFKSAFDQRGISAELTWSIGETASLTYLGSYRDYRSDTVQNSDFVNLEVFLAPGSNSTTGLFDEISLQNHELRLSGTSGRLDWLFGLNIADEHIEQGISLELGTDFAAYVNAVAWYGLIIPATAGTPLEAIPLATGGTFGDVLASPNPAVAFAGGLDPAGAFAGNRYRQDSSPRSIFTHNTLAVTERLDLVLGLRYIDEKKDGSYMQDSASNPACFTTLGNAAALLPASDIGFVGAAFTCFPFAVPADIPGAPLPATFAGEFEDSELMYTGKVMYHVTDDIGVYGSFTHGFKSGGFNLDATAAILGADPRFRSETMDSWELGLKSDWMDRRLRANVALFQMDMDDFQVLEFTGLQFVTFNVPRAKSTGVEIELTAKTSDRLELGIAATYNDAKFPGNCAGANSTPPPQVSALCGNVLANAPEWSGTFSAVHEGQLSDRLDYTVHGSLQFSSEHRTGIQAVDTTTLVPLIDDIQGGYSLLNLGIGISSPDNKWSVGLWGHNVFDKRTHNSSFNVPLRGIGPIGTAARGVFLNAPRTFGVNFTFRN